MTMTEVTAEDWPGKPKEQDIQDAHTAMAGDVPLIESPEDCIFTLPRGVLNGSKWETEVEIRELTGVDEEALARFKEEMNFFNGVLSYGTVRIGTINLSELPHKDRVGILSGLLIGEREQLFLNIGRVTYGDSRVLEHSCPSCGTEAETTVILSEDIEIPEMEAPHTLSYTMETKSGTVITYRLATGADQMAVLERRGASSAEQNTIMLSECMTQIDGKPIVDPLMAAKNLSMGTRGKLLEKLVKEQPSPVLSVEVPCVSCGYEVTLPISWGDIFRP